MRNKTVIQHSTFSIGSQFSHLLPSGTVDPAVPHLSMEDRIARIEKMFGLTLGSTEADVEEWVYSPEGIAEFKAACRRFAHFNDRRLLDAYCKKTGGRTPKEGKHDSR